MTLERFDFQRQCVAQALETTSTGLVLNVGCNEDAGRLKLMDPQRVVNCDLFDYDSVMDRPNPVDVLFDCALDRWPFDDNSAVLVVIGDTLEHLTADEQTAALTEARRVSSRLCITVPEDHRDTNNDETADQYPKGAVHRSIVTRPSLRDLLARTGWQAIVWRNVPYGFVPLGFFVLAE